MKNSSFLLFSLFLTLSLYSQTNVYHPFPDSNAVWNFNYQSYCFSQGQANDNYSIVISGDTIIKNQTYLKLHTPFVQALSIGGCGSRTIGYKGAFREDIANKKVYFVPPLDSTEKLIYDFTLQVGDLINGYLQLHSPDTVLSIDSVLVGNSYRKRWLINRCYNISYIEGIGSTYGFFGQSPGCATDFPGFSLYCFQQNGQSIYPSTAIGCQIITSIKNIESDYRAIDISPNPSFGVVHIDALNPIENVLIYNMKGQLLKRMNNPKGQFELPKEQGLYIVQIEDIEGTLYTRKVVKR